MKPIWHTGRWTKKHTQNLIEELTHAETYRSLTPEERDWLKSIEYSKMSIDELKDLF